MGNKRPELDSRRRLFQTLSLLRALADSIGALRQLFGAVGGDERLDHLVHPAVEEGLDGVQRQPDAVVGHPSLREIVGADALAAVAGADLAASLGGNLALALLPFKVGEAAFHHLERLFLVLALAALVLTIDDRAGGNMDDADGRLGLIDVLTAGAGAAVGGDFQFIHIQLKLEVLRLRQDGDGDGGGMDAAL